MSLVLDLMETVGLAVGLGYSVFMVAERQSKFKEMLRSF